MSFRIKDPIFNHKGEPGIVNGFDSESGQLQVDSNLKSVQNELRHGYIKGLSVDLKDEFNALMDSVHAAENVEEKTIIIQSKLAEIERNPTPRGQILSGYLKSELSHIMHTYNYKPRYYSIYSGNLP